MLTNVTIDNGLDFAVTLPVNRRKGMKWVIVGAYRDHDGETHFEVAAQARTYRTALDRKSVLEGLRGNGYFAFWVLGL